MVRTIRRRDRNGLRPGPGLGTAGRLLLAWHLNAKFEFDARFLTEVEVVFAAVDAATTTVTLEHRNLERFGESAEPIAGKLRGGWPGMLGRYLQHVAHGN